VPLCTATLPSSPNRSLIGAHFRRGLLLPVDEKRLQELDHKRVNVGLSKEEARRARSADGREESEQAWPPSQAESRARRYDLRRYPHRFLELAIRNLKGGPLNPDELAQLTELAKADEKGGSGNWPFENREVRVEWRWCSKHDWVWAVTPSVRRLEAGSERTFRQRFRGRMDDQARYEQEFGKVLNPRLPRCPLCGRTCRRAEDVQ